MLFNYRENRKNGVSTIEYVMMIVVLIAAMLVMQKYILRAMSGRWRNIGDSFGFGRQYDPKKTTECIYDMSVNDWIGLGCYEGCITSCDVNYGVDANKVCEVACPATCLGVCP